jgi:hypothetical protein
MTWAGLPVSVEVAVPTLDALQMMRLSGWLAKSRQADNIRPSDHKYRILPILQAVLPLGSGDLRCQCR